MSGSLSWVGPLLAFVLWCAWWLGCVNWKKTWPTLAGGGWLPVVLLTFIAALAWSSIAPASGRWLGVAVPNFLWQLAAVGLLAAVALLCGWVQGQLGWTPAEVSFEPPAAGHGHGNGHGGRH
jgi:hypothetical protein